MGVESTIKGTGLTCCCKQEAEGNKVRVETYRKNPVRCLKFGKKKKSSYSFFQSTLTGHNPPAKMRRCDRSGKLLVLLLNDR